jgi:hypothetical protein
MVKSVDFALHYNDALSLYLYRKVQRIRSCQTVQDLSDIFPENKKAKLRKIITIAIEKSN